MVFWAGMRLLSVPGGECDWSLRATHSTGHDWLRHQYGTHTGSMGSQCETYCCHYWSPPSSAFAFRGFSYVHSASVRKQMILTYCQKLNSNRYVTAPPPSLTHTSSHCAGFLPSHIITRGTSTVQEAILGEWPHSHNLLEYTFIVVLFYYCCF